MRAIIVNPAERGGVMVAARPRPVPGAGEVLIRTRLAGICSTDLEIARGYMGFNGVLGHEFVGDVVEGPAELLGRRVVGEINCVGPDSPAKTEDERKHAAARTVLGILGRDGAFAEYFTLPAVNCHIVPDSMLDRRAVFVEPIAAALQLTRDHSFSRGERVALIGTGRLGILCAQVVAPRVGRLEVFGRNPRTLEICRRIGLDAREATAVDAGARYDVVIDATGSAEGLRWALAHTRPRGVVLLKSTYAEPPQIDLAPIVIDELRVLGSRCGPIGEALRLLDTGAIDVESLVDGEYTLNEGVAAFEAAAKPGALKILLRMEAGS
ncbi:MAG: alcohol dehydrogenase catalytic domain-containing protein [Phycisphaerales bacterium]|nr:alcohol dehydrogenase catalytic domain-containing protein [Phycisphaerales bacterium]